MRLMPSPSLQDRMGVFAAAPVRSRAVAIITGMLLLMALITSARAATPLYNDWPLLATMPMSYGAARGVLRRAPDSDTLVITGKQSLKQPQLRVRTLRLERGAVWTIDVPPGTPSVVIYAATLILPAEGGVPARIVHLNDADYHLDGAPGARGARGASERPQHTGKDGGTGEPGGPGGRGATAALPDLYLIFDQLSVGPGDAMAMSSRLNIFWDGIRGGNGGTGGAGGDGGDGAQGTDAHCGWFYWLPWVSCAQPQGRGGNGGNGGPPGVGGDAGAGGNGGNVYLVTQVSQRDKAGFIAVSQEGGISGAWGQPGKPGKGGRGGKVGDGCKSCVRNPSKLEGKPGVIGEAASTAHGAAALPGERGASGLILSFLGQS